MGRERGGSCETDVRVRWYVVYEGMCGVGEYDDANQWLPLASQHRGGMVKK